MEAQVKPRSRKFGIQVNDEFAILCRQPPEDGKVNRELIKELSKIFGRRVEIVSGFRSKTKRILIKDVAEEEVLKALESVTKDSNV